MFQSSDTAEEIMSLQNHIAELEDEKGNLQLRLVELDDGLNAQGNFESPPGKHLPIDDSFCVLFNDGHPIVGCIVYCLNCGFAESTTKYLHSTVIFSSLYYL